MTNRNLLGTVLRTICSHLDNDIIRSTLVAAVDDPKTGIGTAAMIIAELAADRGLGPIRRGEAVFDLSELLCLAKQYLKADELAEDDKPDIERFITGVEERLRTGPECLPPELEATVAAHRGVSE